MLYVVLISVSGARACVWCNSPGELESLVASVKQQLRQLAITSSQEPGRIFLGLDMTRAGFVSKDNLREACIKHNLPCADDIIDCVRYSCHFFPHNAVCI